MGFVNNNDVCVYFSGGTCFEKVIRGFVINLDVSHFD